MSSVFSENIKLSIFGQSHAEAIGMTLDGIPAGEPIDRKELQTFLNRRAPGSNDWSTKRKESDEPHFVCGLIEDTTCGSPITALIYNKNTRSGDYDAIRDVPRPGHADMTAHMKYGGFQDVSGGGHFSGRLTAPLCIAGGICMQLLESKGIFMGATIVSIGKEKAKGFDPVTVSESDFCCVKSKMFPSLESETEERMKAEIAKALAEQDSVGGVIECAIVGLPVGLGTHMFDGMENRIARLAFAIPAVKGIEFGEGFASASMRGSENNDPFCLSGEQVKTRTNHHGGILGGITSGMPLVFRIAVKPTPSIGKEQDSVSLGKWEETKLQIKGRHDPCIVPRAVPCVEAIAALAIYDAYIEWEATRRAQIERGSV